MIDFDTCDALDRLHYDLAAIGKMGKAKGASFARSQLEGWEWAVPPEVAAGRVLCRRFNDADIPKAERRALFAAAQSFQAPLLAIVGLLDQGYQLTVEDGRACLRSPDGLSTKLGDPI